MKVLLFLPFALIVSSCLYPEPYAPPRSPYRPGGSAYPYGARGPQGPPASGEYGGETGRYEQLSGQNPSAPGPQGDSRPPAPRIDDDFDPAPGNSAPEPEPKAPPKKQYPTAQRGSKPGEVVSPYAPYKTLDIGDIKPGGLAKDPETGEIFRVP
jgi:hypothetical protein